MPDGVELRAFTHGLQPRTVPGMMQHFVEDWQRFGVDAWNRVPNHWKPDTRDPVGWWTLPVYLGDQFIAPFIGAPPDSCIMTPNAHWVAQCLLTDSLLPERGSVVICDEAAFPSVRHSAMRWINRLDLRLDVIPAGSEGHVQENEILAAINKDTALIFLSHVGFTTGERLSDEFIRDVAQKAHRHGALFALDGYHGIGSLDSPVSALGVDIYFGGLLKEGCGSSGNGFAYVRPGVQIEPAVTGWFGDAAPFAFEEAPALHPEPRMRLMGGTPAIASLYHAVEGVRILTEIGSKQLRADCLEKTRICLDQAQAIGLRIRSPLQEEKRSAMVILEVKNALALSTYLKERNIYTDSRQNRYVRMAPFIWNTAADIYNTFDALASALNNNQYTSVKMSDTDRSGPVT